jgi:tetratricopeptide (TPR) repeat protein
MLVVLDNAHDEAQVRPLLPGALTCRVIVPSRLHLAGLAAIDGAHTLMLDVLTDAEARDLLVQRLGADRVSADPEAAAQIIKTCAHLPLALSVVAARVATVPDLPLAEVAAEVAAYPDLDGFSAGSDPVADVRVVLSWSYRQLDPGAASAFRLAGLHPGADFDRYAIAALTGTVPEEADEKLATLARGSLVQPAGPGRYRMHDLLKAYARELATTQDTDVGCQAALTRLFDYYLYTASLAMDAAFPAESHRRPSIPPADTPSPPVRDAAGAWAWLDAERACLAATAHVAGDGWPDYSVRLSAILWRYLETAGHTSQARIIHEQAARVAGSVGSSTAEASALMSLALTEAHVGRLPAGIAGLEQALALSMRAEDKAGQARALAGLGIIALYTDHYQEAVGRLEQAAALYRSLGDLSGAASALSNLGVAERRLGHHEQAAGRQEQALATFRELGDKGGEAWAIYRLGRASGTSKRACGWMSTRSSGLRKALRAGARGWQEPARTCGRSSPPSATTAAAPPRRPATWRYHSAWSTLPSLTTAPTRTRSISGSGPTSRKPPRPMPPGPLDRLPSSGEGPAR